MQPFLYQHQSLGRSSSLDEFLAFLYQKRKQLFQFGTRKRCKLVLIQNLIKLTQQCSWRD